MAVIAAVGTMLFAAPSTSADPGDPFDPMVPRLFLSQGPVNGTTTLYDMVAAPDGSASLVAIGGAAPVAYNSIGYDPASNHLFGVVFSSGNAAYPKNSLIRIGQEGSITRVGTSAIPTSGAGSIANLNMGVLVDGYLYVGWGNSATMARFDIDDGSYTTFTIPSATQISDLAYLDGYFWGFKGNQLLRFDLLSATSPRPVTTFGVGGLSADDYGAAWTYANGNLGFLNSTTGDIVQIAMANSASSAPDVSIVAVSSGLPSTRQDAASAPGLPTDLSVTASLDHDVYVPGDPLAHSIDITNEGSTHSTGSVLSVTLSDAFASASTTTAGCVVSGLTVTCTIGALAPGSHAFVSILGVTKATASGPITSSVVVTANEVDPVSSNNADAPTAQPAAPSLAMVTTGAPAGPGPVVPGSIVNYLFSITNTGNVTLSDVAPVAGTFSGTGSLSTITCGSGAASLAPSITVVCAATYAVTIADATAGDIVNTATATGISPTGGIVTAGASSAIIRVEPAPTPTPTSVPTTTVVRLPSTPIVVAGVLPATGRGSGRQIWSALGSTVAGIVVVRISRRTRRAA